MRINRLLSMLMILLTVPILTPSVLQANGVSPTFLVSKTWGGTGGNTTGDAVALDPSGFIFVAGTTSSFGPGSPGSTAIIVLKYAADGTLQWQKLWSNSSETASGIALDSSGNVYVAGTISGASPFSPTSALLFKLNSSGNLDWQKTWSYGYYTNAYAVAVDSSNNIYIAGSTDCSNNSCFNNAVLLKFDTNGNVVWQRAWNAGIGAADAIALDTAGNIYLTGYESAYQAAGGNGWQVMLLKFSPTGSLLLQRIHGGTGSEFGSGIALDRAGNIYVTGATQGNSANNNLHLILLKLDPTGNLLAQRTWGGAHQDWGRGIAVDPTGNILIVGYTSSYGTQGTCSGGIRWQGDTTCYNSLLMKITSTLAVNYTLVYGGAANHDNLGNGVALDSGANAIMTGTVEAPPPYTSTTGNNTFGIPTLPITPNGNNTLIDPAFVPAAPRNGMIQTVTGSETFAGKQDALLIKYGPTSANPPNITNQTNQSLATILTSFWLEIIVAAISIFLVAGVLLKRRRRSRADSRISTNTMR